MSRRRTDPGVAQRFAALTPSTIAEFYVEIVDQQGHRRHSHQPVRICDTEHGRWALRVRPSNDDEQIDLCRRIRAASRKFWTACASNRVATEATVPS